MDILVACEESQIVTKAFRDKGHAAYSCDIIETSGDYPEWHLHGDVRQYLNEKWDMIIAFPPCTYLSNSGAQLLYNGPGKLNKNRYEKGIEAKKLFIDIWTSSCNKIVIENPKASKVYNLPKFHQEIQPFMFGHPYTKTTRLWLKNVPMLMATDIVIPKKSYVLEEVRSSKDRSKTFSGVASAMAAQWG